MYGRICDLGTKLYPPRVALSPRTSVNPRYIQRSWGFHTVRSSIAPGSHRFCLRLVGIEAVPKKLFSWRGILFSPGDSWCWLCDRDPANQWSAVRVGASTPCGTFSTMWISVLVPRWWIIYIYGGVYDPGMGSYRPRVALANARANHLSAGGVCFCSPCEAVSARRNSVFVPWLLEL